MIRFIATFVLIMLSVIIVTISLELRSWNSGIVLNDTQNFIKVETTQLDIRSWEKYLGHKLDFNLVTSNIFKIDLTSVTAGELPNLLDKFEKLRYIQLHKLDITAKKPDQIFEISAVLTLN